MARVSISAKCTGINIEWRHILQFESLNGQMIAYYSSPDTVHINNKQSSWFTQTLSHFQMHASSTCPQSVFEIVRPSSARGFLVSWFTKWMPVCFGVDWLNNLLYNYTVSKSLCVHSGLVWDSLQQRVHDHCLDQIKIQSHSLIKKRENSLPKAQFYVCSLLNTLTPTIRV